MSETLILQNTGRGPVSFIIYPPVELEGGMPKHKRRKALRDSLVSIKIIQGQSVDLVEKTGLTRKQLEDLPEVKTIIRNPFVRVLDTMDPPAPPAPAPAPKPAPVEVPKKVEPPKPAEPPPPPPAPEPTKAAEPPPPPPAEPAPVEPPKPAEPEAPPAPPPPAGMPAEPPRAIPVKQKKGPKGVAPKP